MLLLQLIFNLWLLKDSVDQIEDDFVQFIEKYGKGYKNNATEYSKRKDIFQKSLKQIQYLNSFRTHEESARFGLTKYSDLEPHEFMQIVSKGNKKKVNETLNGWRSSRGSRSTMLSKNNLLDHGIKGAFDWRDRKVVSEVKNQGRCGACWAHSVVATVESMVAIDTGHLEELSVQQLVDCSGEAGCSGGDTCSTLAWMVIEKVPLQTRARYPTLDHAGPCQLKPTHDGIRIRPNFTCDSFVGREEAMVQKLATHGPLIAAVDSSTWQHYLGGTIQYHCYNQLNHAVQITGYDLTAEIPHFKVRNTWDVGFGIDGYIHIEIGKNLCGIAEEVSAITIDHFPLFVGTGRTHN